MRATPATRTASRASTGAIIGDDFDRIALVPAAEAFAYCPDAVHQDYGSLDGVAERLLRPIRRRWAD
ncbi:hypothetical protein [Nocardia harenae]|uniref:hypothetical protein n=1 Tax=Nocardia harenae TaxID=358707 RepID=UPI00082CCA95|nr:hypothetical protein [Nocardia harenae]